LNLLNASLLSKEESTVPSLRLGTPPTLVDIFLPKKELHTGKVKVLNTSLPLKKKIHCAVFDIWLLTGNALSLGNNFCQIND
jgi:hypothetical protein